MKKFLIGVSIFLGVIIAFVSVCFITTAVRSIDKADWLAMRDEAFGIEEDEDISTSGKVTGVYVAETTLNAMGENQIYGITGDRKAGKFKKTIGALKKGFISPRDIFFGVSKKRAKKILSISGDYNDDLTNYPEYCDIDYVEGVVDTTEWSGVEYNGESETATFKDDVSNLKQGDKIIVINDEGYACAREIASIEKVSGGYEASLNDVETMDEVVEEISFSGSSLPDDGTAEVKQGLFTPGMSTVHAKETKPFDFGVTGEVELEFDSNGNIIDVTPSLDIDQTLVGSNDYADIELKAMDKDDLLDYCERAEKGEEKLREAGAYDNDTNTDDEEDEEDQGPETYTYKEDKSDTVKEQLSDESNYSSKVTIGIGAEFNDVVIAGSGDLKLYKDEGYLKMDVTCGEIKGDFNIEGEVSTEASALEVGLCTVSLPLVCEFVAIDAELGISISVDGKVSLSVSIPDNRVSYTYNKGKKDAHSAKFGEPVYSVDAEVSVKPAITGAAGFRIVGFNVIEFDAEVGAKGTAEAHKYSGYDYACVDLNIQGPQAELSVKAITLPLTAKKMPLLGAWLSDVIEGVDVASVTIPKDDSVPTLGWHLEWDDDGTFHSIPYGSLSGKPDKLCTHKSGDAATEKTSTEDKEPDKKQSKQSPADMVHSGQFPNMLYLGDWEDGLTWQDNGDSYSVTGNIYGQEVIPVSTYESLKPGDTWEGLFHTYTIGEESDYADEDFRYRERCCEITADDNGTKYYIYISKDDEDYSRSYHSLDSFADDFRTANDGEKFYIILSEPTYDPGRSGVDPSGHGWNLIEENVTFTVDKDATMYVPSDDVEMSMDEAYNYESYTAGEIRDEYSDFAVETDASGNIIALCYLSMYTHA